MNGNTQEIPEGSTVADVVADLGLAEMTRGVAVALDGEVVSRSSWAERSLSGGDRLEVLRAVAGG